MTTQAEYAPVRLMPDDEHNQALVANVHPPAWRNPEPAGATTSSSSAPVRPGS